MPNRRILIFPFLLYDGLTLYPFIILRHKRFMDDPTLLNHESIHLQQQLELLIVPFYIIYLFHYLINLLYFRNHSKAYRNIIFEKEAFRKEGDFSYLAHRKRWQVFFSTKTS